MGEVPTNADAAAIDNAAHRGPQSIFGSASTRCFHSTTNTAGSELYDEVTGGQISASKARGLCTKGGKNVDRGQKRQDGPNRPT